VCDEKPDDPDDEAHAPKCPRSLPHSAHKPAPSVSDATTPIHPELAPLAGLVGQWTGEGRGSYPTIADFAYTETLVFTHTGKPFLAYVQRSNAAADGRPLHVESGYLRLSGPARVEFVAAQPTGITEVDEGTVHTDSDGGLVIRLVSRSVGLTSTAKPVTQTERTLTLAGGVLRTRLAMAAVGHPLTHHLASQLHRSQPATKQDTFP
jgi:hypothetical protein